MIIAEGGASLLEGVVPMRNLRRLIFALPLAAMPALLTGCPIYGDGGDEDCERDSNCPSGFVCDASGACVDAPCTMDSHCGSGEICMGGVCTPGDRSCRTHGDCAVGSYCDATSDRCSPSGTCTADSSCTGGFWCDFRGTCVPHDPGQCRSAADCASSQLCIEGLCRDVSATCQFDRECPPGTACLNNECSTICGGAGDCLPGDSCVGSFCRTNPTECTTSASCGTGEHCVEGRCLPDCAGRGSSCAAGSACANDQFCRPDFAPEAFCPATPCQTGRVCLDGVCRTPCTSDENCRMLDSQLPLCRLDSASGMNLCVAESEVRPECRVQSDCSASGDDCQNGACR